MPARSLTARSGISYSYSAPPVGLVGGQITRIGAFHSGLLGVGIDEVIIPQLVKEITFPCGRGRDIGFTVTRTITAASFNQVTALIDAGGVNVIPWNVVCPTIPVIIIRGQINR